ncbi:3D domain-containing protein [Sporocytophaga myxococcoides]|uniref:3D domain-containing protein n=1 Tax=Sporocytophaga myxococcoides TaxID=153721 RepID=UPI00041AC29D|nr:3D domain-containing protein [Sporocytophaga myxococcoides]
MRLYLTIGFLFSSITLFGQSNSKKISLWATYYYVPTLMHNEKGIDILDKNEKKTGFKLDSCDWCNAVIEGTVFIKKENRTYVFNYAGRSKEMQYDCRQCSKYKNYGNYLNSSKVLWELSGGFGKGCKNYNLVPFITIAVDTVLVPIGSVIYIPMAKGVKYIDAEGKLAEHEGYFFAGDVGSKIKGNHIDVFLGSSKENPFGFVKSNQDGTFEAYIVTDKNLIAKYANLHK